MAATCHIPLMPWELSTDADARFLRILRINLIACLLLGLAIPFLPLPEIENAPLDEPKRLAKLILEVKPVPPPPQPKPLPKQVIKQPTPKKAVKTKRIKPKTKVVKRIPVKPKVSARKKAEQAGLLALKDSLSDLRQNTVATNLKRTRHLSQAGGQARSVQRAVLTAGTTRRSGGIQTASLSRNTGGGRLATRATTRIHSPVGNASGGGAGSSNQGERSAGRSMEEIQMIFDRNKGAIYSVYNRALRKDPTLQGKIVLQLTIAPSGKVTYCTLASSELHDSAVAQKITQRVKLFDFGAKDVGEVTITYPIDFLPA